MSKLLLNVYGNIYSLINKRTFCAKRRRVRSKMDLELKSRQDPVVIKLDTPEFHSIFTPEVKELKKLFDKYQYEIRIAGGAVRDLLMGLQPKDIDFATVATPQQMKDMFTTENIRLINMKGEKHGTITPRINDKENFEVTTLRVDMVTDGRHAEVEYTTDWKLDANRRDLTINSMFLGFDGSVHDYFFGFEDVQKRRVAFVGDADVRIKEDYLRILRYFRFYGRIAETPDNHDPLTIEVIKRNVEGLQIISGERIWVEFKKILQGNYSYELLESILNAGIGKYIGLPEKPNMEEFHRIKKYRKDLNLYPMTILASLLKNVDEVIDLNNRLKLSVYDRDLTYFIVENREEKISTRPLMPYEKLVLHSRTQGVTSNYVCELLKYHGKVELLKEFNDWEIPRFVINGNTLKELGIKPPKIFTPILKKLKNIWIENDYKQSKEDLLQLVPSIVDELESNKKNSK